MAEPQEKDEVKELLKKHQYFLSTPNIVSLSLRCEKKDGKVTGRYILQVGVIKKLPVEEIKHPDILLPKTIEHETASKTVTVSVQVVEQGVICPMEGPYLGGSDIRTMGLTNSGTLGVNTIYKGEYRLLSAAHVLTRFDPANIGKEIEARTDFSDYKATGARVEGHVEVVLYDSNAEQNPVFARQDLAWARVTEDQALPGIIDFMGFNAVANGIRDPVEGEKVCLYGASSKKVQGDIVVSDTSVLVKVPITVVGKTKYVYFEDVCSIDILKSSASLSPGDSGAAVIAQSDRKVVGIFFSYGFFNAHFCKLTY